MFEFDREIVDTLMSSNEQFRRLFEKHRALKEQVHEAHIGTLAIDDLELERLKKQKLRLKDQMAHMISDFRASHASA